MTDTTKNHQDTDQENRVGEIITTPYGKIKPISIVKEMQKSYLDYAMSVIVARALPDVRDGLKPVHRRILYAMKELGLTHQAKHKKSARIVGEVLGKYHPHGDSAVYDAMVRLAQDFSMRYPLVDGQGNFGSIDGDSPAAMRYTEARLAKITQELLADIDKNTVNFVDNFDGTFQEPTVLPAKLPNLLLMGSDGIAVGMATKIPPHNLGEVVDALITLINKGHTTRQPLPENVALEDIPFSQLKGEFTSSATVDDLLEHIQGPDFPTGGIIYDIQAIRQVYATGKGKIVIRAQTDIVETKKGKYQIVITEIPYQVNKAKLITQIASLVRKKKIDEIADIRDESDREGLRIVIDLKKSARPKTLLNKLFQLTNLQTSFPANMVALDKNSTPHLMTLKQILTAYLDHRQEVVIRRSQFELSQAKARIHILDGYLKALEHLDAVIETIKKSPDTPTAKTNLMSRFGFTDIQATAILNLQLRRLSALERQKIEDEHRELLTTIDTLTNLLQDPQAILNVIIQELQTLKETYGDSRRTKVIKSKIGQFKEEDLIAKEDNLITLTKSGYIKRMPLGTYRTQHRGGKGVSGMTTKQEDEILHLTIGNTHDTLLFFTDTGKVFSLRTFEIPQGSRTAKGKAIINLIDIDQQEQVQALIPITQDTFSSPHTFILTVTQQGRVKKTPLKEYQNIRSSGKIGIALKKGDAVVTVKLVTDNDYLLLVTHNGKSIKFDANEVKPSGRDTQGVKGITLKNGDYVVAAEVIAKNPPRPQDKRKKFFRQLLVVTEKGIGKRTDINEYPLQHRGGQGLKVANINAKTGKIAGALLVNEQIDNIILTTKKAQVIKLPLKNIKVLGRDTQGVILMRPHPGDSIAAVTAY